MKMTAYFEDFVLKVKRPYLRAEWCERVRLDHEHSFVQENGRISFFGRVPELKEAVGTDSYLRVVTLEDGETIHNAYPDRDYTPAEPDRRQE